MAFYCITTLLRICDCKISLFDLRKQGMFFEKLRYPKAEVEYLLLPLHVSAHFNKCHLSNFCIFLWT